MIKKKTKEKLIKERSQKMKKNIEKNSISYSKEYKKYLQKNIYKKIAIVSFQIGLLVALIGVWEWLARAGVIDVFITSSPSRIFKTIVTLFKEDGLLRHIWATLSEALIGFAISTVLGSLIAIILWWNETIRRVLDPYIVVLNSLPKIALGPIIIVWVGAGAQAIIMMDVLIMVIITIISMLNAFISCDSNKVFLLRSMGANKFQVLTKLVMPNALCEFISVLKINVGLTWVGTIMGEYLVSREGLGYLIVYGGQVFKLDLVMASTVILCVLAALMYFIVAFFEKRAYKHREGR